MRQPLLIACLIAASAGLAPIATAAAPVATNPGVSPAIAAAVADPQRKPENRVRDRYRHPAETLSFFGVTPDMTVVEILPGSGWYSEILAPLLRDKGRYIAAAPATGKGLEVTARLLASDPQRFGKAGLSAFDPKGESVIAPPGSADRVLTFRAVHNFLTPDGAVARRAFASFYAALKPGGMLGIVDHRLPEDRPAAKEGESGYIKTSTMIRLATAAGFRLAGRSEINANPLDKADYPGGVWTLPPSLALGEKDRARYQAIGESDRMTLKFIKPKA